MSAVTIIAKRGDVILKLGKDGEVATDALVSSVVLSFASPVFEAMFGGHFAEGQALSTDSPHIVPLPDDNTESIMLICKIAHLQAAQLPEELSTTAFADFAIACDKYSCGEAVQAWSKVWAMKMLQTPPTMDFEKLILATYMLDMAHEFYQTTLVITRDCSADTSISISAYGTDFLPAIVFDKLRTNKRACEDASRVTLHSVTRSSCECDGYRRNLGSFIINLCDAGIWPLTSASVSDIKRKALLMKEMTNSACTSNRSYCNDLRHIKSKLISAINEVYESVKGVCLDCLKREALGATRKCRITH
jgi:hypothetical protein